VLFTINFTIKSIPFLKHEDCGKVIVVFLIDFFGVKDLNELRRRFLFSLIFIAFIVTIGSAGYMVIEGWGCLDSLYMTMITIASA